MAAPLSRLASDWMAQTSTYVSSPSGIVATVDVNPNRLAIGFTYSRAHVISLIPVISSAEEFGFLLSGPGTEWFWWQKHGIIVGLPWVASGLAGIGDGISVLEIIQTQRGVANVP